MAGDKTKKTDNYWYNKFEYLNKKFYQMTNSKQAGKSEHIIYFCNKHHTKISSTEYTKSNNIKKIAKCNARVYYIKKRKEYYIDWDHSTFCNETVKKSTKI